MESNQLCLDLYDASADYLSNKTIQISGDNGNITGQYQGINADGALVLISDNKIYSFLDGSPTEIIGL